MVRLGIALLLPAALDLLLETDGLLPNDTLFPDNDLPLLVGHAELDELRRSCEDDRRFSSLLTLKGPSDILSDDEERFMVRLVYNLVYKQFWVLGRNPNEI